MKSGTVWEEQKGLVPHNIGWFQRDQWSLIITLKTWLSIINHY